MKPVDWLTYYQPAIEILLSGGNPYDVLGFYNPPWLLLLLLPIWLLPEPIGVVVLLLITIAGFALVAIRLGATPTKTLLFLLSPPAVHCYINGGIEWLVMLGLSMPPWLGMFFVLVKPQVGIGGAIYWLFEAWHKERILGVLMVACPVGVALLLSLILFGLPHQTEELLGTVRNVSPWPLGIAIGVYLMSRHEKLYAVAASPFLSPYVAFHTYIVCLLPILSRPIREMAMVVLALWAIVLMGAI